MVAADSRTSTGSYIANRTSDKLTPVAERATLSCSPHLLAAPLTLLPQAVAGGVG